MKSKNIIITVLLFLLAYGIGFVSGVKKKFPYEQAKLIKSKFEKRSEVRLPSCEIKIIDKLPTDFSVIVGHAYGSPKHAKIDDFIAKNVENFLVQNEEFINTLILTGDVFSVPSSSKWARLFDQFSSLDIMVAPGNHDVLRPDSREVFSNNEFIKSSFPFKIQTNEASIVIDDSISSVWRDGESLKFILSNSTEQSIFVARHNIVVSELLPYANSSAGSSNLPIVKKFVDEFPRDKSITWVMGDGGAFATLPRLTCHTFENHRFIVNGIGEVEDDTVLIVHDGEVFQYVLQ